WQLALRIFTIWSVGADSAADGWAGAGAGAEAAGGDGAASCGGCVSAHANSNPDRSTAVVLLFILYSRRKKIFWSEPLSRWNWFTLSDMVQWQKAVHPSNMAQGSRSYGGRWLWPRLCRDRGDIWSGASPSPNETQANPPHEAAPRTP